MVEQEPMLCPSCGVAMNHHADKLDYSGAFAAPVGGDTDAGVLIEAHTCPRCGQTQTRPAPAERV